MKTEFEEDIALLKENALCGLVTVEGIFFSWSGRLPLTVTLVVTSTT